MSAHEQFNVTKHYTVKQNLMKELTNGIFRSPLLHDPIRFFQNQSKARLALISIPST